MVGQVIHAEDEKKKLNNLLPVDFKSSIAGNYSIQSL